MPTNPIPEMTLAEAVEILNRFRHHGHSDWYIAGGDPSNSFVRGNDRYDCFEPFEVVAIAEKYSSLAPDEPNLA